MSSAKNAFSIRIFFLWFHRGEILTVIPFFFCTCPVHSRFLIGSLPFESVSRRYFTYLHFGVLSDRRNIFSASETFIPPLNLLEFFWRSCSWAFLLFRYTKPIRIQSYNLITFKWSCIHTPFRDLSSLDRSLKGVCASHAIRWYFNPECSVSFIALFIGSILTLFKLSCIIWMYFSNLGGEDHDATKYFSRSFPSSVFVYAFVGYNKPLSPNKRYINIFCSLLESEVFSMFKPKLKNRFFLRRLSSYTVW